MQNKNSLEQALKNLRNLLDGGEGLKIIDRNQAYLDEVEYLEQKEEYKFVTEVLPYII